MQGLRDFILHYCPTCETRIDALSHFNPNDWLGWVQLITSIIGVLWILYQFNKLREDAEAKLQEYLAKHLDKKRINAAAEREQMLSKLNAPRQSGLIAGSLYLTGQFWRGLYFARRFVPFADPPSHSNLALVWMAAGMDRKARDEFNELGEELLRQAKLYEEEAKAKRIAAGNAYLFAGRLSANCSNKRTLLLRSEDRRLTLGPPADHTLEPSVFRCAAAVEAYPSGRSSGLF
jgi:hypothetical protein